MTVAELQSRMGAIELAEWMALERIEGPRGEDREDIRQGHAAMINAAAHGLKDAKLKDFMPCVPKPELSEEQIADKVKQALHGR